MKAVAFKVSTFLLSSLIVWGATSASAHSFPEVQTPAAGQTLTASPSEITIKYDAPIEKLFAKLQILSPDGKNIAESEPVVGSDGYTLSVKVPPLKPGEYQVKWGVVCIDTHHTQGSYSFTVAGNGQ